MSDYYARPTNGVVQRAEVLRRVDENHHALICSCYETETAEQIAAALNRLTPDRERVARAMQDAHGPMHPEFALALADAAIKAMEGNDDA